MPKVLRLLVICLAACLLAGRVEAATVTLAWDPNTEPDLARYLVGYRTSPSGAETVVNAGLTTTWALTTAAPGTTYYFRVYAENQAGLRSAPSTQVSTTVPALPAPPTGGGLALDRSRLTFGASKNGAAVVHRTPPQALMISRTGASSPGWTASTANSWLRVSPASRTGPGQLTVSVEPGALAPGEYDGTVAVRPSGSTTSLSLSVRIRVYANGTTGTAAGYVDTPGDGLVNVSGALPVTGWAVDDVGVARVDIYRDSVPGEADGQVFIGTASFIAGARPDVESRYVEYPMAHRAGWGLLVLTNMLPDRTRGGVGGNGAFRLHAYAVDQEGRSSHLGSRSFSANNAAAVKPFGSIDTPSQGGTASGGQYVVFGWALSPRATIPTDGSTISVFVDGVNVGRPTYNNHREDIATLFPDHSNAKNAVGYYLLNTSNLADGLHTISWVVTDTSGYTDGIGSRFFTVANGTTTASLTEAVQGSAVSASSHGEAIGQDARMVSETVPSDYGVVELERPASDDPLPETLYPEWAGEVLLQTVETEQILLRLGTRFDDNLKGSYEGYVVIGGEMRPLPIGSSLDPQTGVFQWNPGAGFVGAYELVFIRKGEGWKTKIPVFLRIAPKFKNEPQ